MIYGYLLVEGVMVGGLVGWVVGFGGFWVVVVDGVMVGGLLGWVVCSLV